jgi:hypothetical protein
VKYEKIKEYSETQIKKALANNKPNELLHVILSVALYSDDLNYAENFCVQLSNHEHFNVRGNAILGFGHLARIHGKLDENKIKPIVEKALTDENEFVRSQADGAKDDIEHFLKWKFNK